MPPKSASKKDTVLWVFCEKCKINFVAKEFGQHDNECGQNYDQSRLSYIHNNIFYTTKFDKKEPLPEELTDLTATQLNRFIFMSENALKLCNFIIGECVVIDASTSNSNLLPTVRCVWPIPNKFTTQTFFSTEDYEYTWKSLQGLQINVRKLNHDPLPAGNILLEIEKKPNIENNCYEEMKKILKRKLKNAILSAGNEISLNFYNKTIQFKVKSISSSLIDNTEDLSKNLENLSLIDNVKSKEFYQITLDTNFEILSKENNLTENEFKPHIVRKSQIAGMTGLIGEIEESMSIALGMAKTEVNFIKKSRCILLYGPSGCGKSLLAEAVCNESTAEVIKINTAELFSKYLGESEVNLMSYFKKAYKIYPKPCTIIVEDVDNLCPKQSTNDTIKRVTVAFMNILDDLHQSLEGSKTFIICITNNIENINPSLRRSGRIDTEIEVGVPSPNARLEILKMQLANVKNNLTKDDISQLADITHGYVGSDLLNLVSKAYLITLRRVENRGLLIVSDLNEALNEVKPSAMREVLLENPNIRWEDIGGQEELKLKLKQAIEWPILYRSKFEQLGIRAPRGVLMFGPPGCSKTMIAKALATESKLNFLSIKGPELFSMWVGESERAVRDVFRKARLVAPSIIFFDEIDAIGGERSSGSGGGSSVSERVLAQMLTELDGIESLKDVTMVAATNRPDMIDKALLRPGRIDRIIYVGLPDQKDRREIIKIKLKKVPLADDVDIEEMVNCTEGYSGAEIQAVCQEAVLFGIKENLAIGKIENRHFHSALKLIKPRTSPALLEIYEKYLNQS